MIITRGCIHFIIVYWRVRNLHQVIECVFNFFLVLKSFFVFTHWAKIDFFVQKIIFVWEKSISILGQNLKFWHSVQRNTEGRILIFNLGNCKVTNFEVFFAYCVSSLCTKRLQNNIKDVKPSKWYFFVQNLAMKTTKKKTSRESECISSVPQS